MINVTATATRQDVAKTARELITANGTTTTLDVKNALRANGFWAKQDMVRNAMLDITENDGDIVYRETGNGHREYYFGVTPISNTASSVSVTAFPIPVLSYNQVMGASRPKINHDNDPATYIVSHQDGHSVRQYDNVPRGAAKHQWAKDTGFDFRLARTKKIIA